MILFQNNKWVAYDEAGLELGKFEHKELAEAHTWLYIHWLETGETYTMEKKAE